MNYKRNTVILIAVSTIARLLIAPSIELTNAEVYYWALSLKPQWNYFDHPPMVAWLIRLTTANLLLHNELFVRLGAIVSSAACTWLIFKVGTVINSLQTGWFAALLYTSSIYASYIAGVFILPDSPQMIFWLLSLLLLIKISHSASHSPKSTRLWCLFGLTSGLCIMSKVHGLCLWFGVALYVLLINRKILKYPGIYIAALITLLIISPIIIWNLQNDFATYKFHSERVALSGAGVNVGLFAKQLLFVIFVSNPINFFLIVSSLFVALKGKLAVDKKDIQIVLFCSLPLIVVLLFISLFRETLAHWSGPAYSSLLILPAIRLSTYNNEKRRNIPTGIKVALACTAMTAVLEVLVINYFPGTISKEKEGLKTGTDDASLDMYGWEGAGAKFDSLYRSDVAKNTMPAGAPIIVTKWYPAAHIDFYFAAKTKQRTIGIGSILDLHQYYWMNDNKKPLKKGDGAYCIVPSNLFDYKMLDKVLHKFDKFEMALTITEYRGGIICKQFFVFRIKGYGG